MHSLEGPAWDNSSEYAGVDAPALLADIAEAEKLAAAVAQAAAALVPHVEGADKVSAADAPRLVKAAQEATKLRERGHLLAYNARVFCDCELSVNGRDAKSKEMAGRIEPLLARLAEAYNPVIQFLKMTRDDVVEAFLADPECAPHGFGVKQLRTLRDQTLSLAEENLVIALQVDGLTAWGKLYDDIATSIECKVELPSGIRSLGVAAASSLLQDESEEVRRAGWQAIQKGWRAHEESVAGILNAITGWRLEMYRRRSSVKPVHYLDAPLHGNRIQRATLDAMLAAVAERKGDARRVLNIQAKLLGKTRSAPWDLFAPCPAKGGGTTYRPSFDEAIDLCARSYGAVDPEMGAFVRTMADNRWIEGRVGPAKRPGGYCTKFVKSRTPRIYMTYAGGMREMKTLAHELGHAFHNWVMRDMPLPEAAYPMTLAETASIFGETVVNEELLNKAASPAERLQFTWANAREVEAFVLNIPARFAFEVALNERRKSGPLAPAELSKLMTTAWQESYGDALSEVEPLFWATKLHFSLASISFYNFPYTFGYLFALGVYAQRERLGDEFYSSYVALLRDTGRMTAEEVAAKHLGADLTKPEFWRQSLKVAARAVDEFEEAARPFMQS